MGDDLDELYAARRAALEQRYHSLPSVGTMDYWRLIEQATPGIAVPLEVLARCVRDRAHAGARDQAGRIFGVIMQHIQRRVQARVKATVRACPTSQRSHLGEELEQECLLQVWKELIDTDDTWFFEQFTHRLDRVMGHVAHTFMEQRGYWKRPGVAMPTRVPASQQDSLEKPVAPGDAHPLSDLVEDPTAVDEFYQTDLASDIKALMDELQPEDRALIYDLFWSDLTQKEVADRLGITDRTVRNRLERILKQLREGYQGYQGGEEVNRG